MKRYVKFYKAKMNRRVIAGFLAVIIVLTHYPIIQATAAENQQVLLQEKEELQEGKTATPDEGLTPPSEGMTPPSEGGTTPPSEGGTTPPSEGGATPPEGGATPPPEGGATPPEGGATPPEGGATPPPEGGTVPPTEGATPPEEGTVPPTDGVQKLPDDKELTDEEKKQKEEGTGETFTGVQVENGVATIFLTELGAGASNTEQNTVALESALAFGSSEVFVAGEGAAPDYQSIQKVRIMIPEGEYQLSNVPELQFNTDLVLENGAAIRQQSELLVFTDYGNEKSLSIEGGTWSAGEKAVLSLQNTGATNVANTSFENVSLEVGSEGFARNSADAGGSNVTISGNQITGGEYGYGIRINYGCSNVKVLNNTLNNINGNGILILGDNALIDGNKINGTKGAAAVYAENARNVKLQNNTIKNSINTGIIITNVDGAILDNNSVEISGLEGINITATVKGTVIVNGNTVSVSGSHNMTVAGGSSCSITFNNSTQSKGMGLFLANINKAQVTDNIFSSNEQQGMIVYQAAQANILNNNLSSNLMDGILVHTAADKPQIKGNTVSKNGGDGIKTSGLSAPVIMNNIVTENRVGIFVNGCGDSLIQENKTAANRDKGILVQGDNDQSGPSRGYQTKIWKNDVQQDKQTGILAFRAKAEILENTVNGTGAVGGEGIVVQYSGESIIKLNKISNVKSAYDNIGNGIIVADKSDDVMVYKNTVSQVGNHGIQVTYGSTNVTVLANDVNGSGRQGITFSRNSSGKIAGNQVKNSRNHGIINEASNVQTGGNYIVNVGQNSIAYNGSTGTIMGNVIVKGSIFTPNSQVVEKDNALVNGETNQNPFATEGMVEDFVKRMYLKVLGRPSEEKGMQDWTARLLVREFSGAEVAMGFVFSDEYLVKKTNDSSYIDTLYSAMFDRQSDSGGKNGWIKDLQTGFSRKYIFMGFAESAEFQNLCNKFGINRGYVVMEEARDKNRGVTQFVSRIYLKALSRSKIDIAGLNMWCGQILNGTAPKDVVAGFIFSDEFKNKKLSDDAFVKVMYETYFDRKADEAGYRLWMNKLKAGASRQEVVDGFSESTEFYNLVSSFGL